MTLSQNKNKGLGMLYTLTTPQTSFCPKQELTVSSTSPESRHLKPALSHTQLLKSTFQSSLAMKPKAAPWTAPPPPLSKSQILMTKNPGFFPLLLLPLHSMYGPQMDPAELYLQHLYETWNVIPPRYLPSPTQSCTWASNFHHLCLNYLLARAIRSTCSS